MGRCRQAMLKIARTFIDAITLRINHSFTYDDGVFSLNMPVVPLKEKLPLNLLKVENKLELEITQGRCRQNSRKPVEKEGTKSRIVTRNGAASRRDSEPTPGRTSPF